MSAISAELSQVTYRPSPFRFFQLTQLSFNLCMLKQNCIQPPGKVPIDHLMIPLPLICVRGKCSYSSFMLAWTKIGAMYKLRIMRALHTTWFQHICFWSIYLDIRQMLSTVCTYLSLSSLWSKIFEVKNLKKKQNNKKPTNQPTKTVQKSLEKWIFFSELDATGKWPILLWSSKQLLLNDSVR